MTEEGRTFRVGGIRARGFGRGIHLEFRVTERKVLLHSLSSRHMLPDAEPPEVFDFPKEEGQ